MIKSLIVMGLLGCAAFSSSRAAESASPILFASPAWYADGSAKTFIEDANEEPSPTPKRHKKSSSKHSSARTSAHARSASESPRSKSTASGEPRKTHSKSEISSGAQVETNRDSTEKAKPSPTPAPTPSPEPGGSPPQNTPVNAAPPASIKPEKLSGFSRQPAEVQQLIRSSLTLTERNLTYKYGSADPTSGGMDCSGFIFYVLTNAGYKDVPRDSAGQYVWVRKSGNFRAVLGRSLDSFEFEDLKPGDLLFWSGTYAVDREFPITHVMIYLGKEKSTGKPVMVGSTDGRTYDGIRRFGVSVFDFKLPSGKPNNGDPDLTARFEGYGKIPGLTEEHAASSHDVDDRKDTGRSRNEK
ncbi:MAG TPA: NlpC/P60 family protein [Chthoniobacterales bacterium]|nr:NlpC/P60 family protein [Chthoniobacterales bacterium]